MKIESKAECEIDTFDGIFAFNSSSFNEEILIGIYKQIIENKETEFRILDMKGGSNENK